MNFPQIVSEEKIVFPKIETLEQINEFEEAFEQWIQGAFRDGGPKPQQIYIFRKCMKPWFQTLYNQEGSDKDFLIKQYGTYLRNTFIESAKSKFNQREYLKNSEDFFSKIKFNLRTTSLAWAQSGTDGIVINFGKLMGSECASVAKKAVDGNAKFDNYGDLLS